MARRDPDGSDWVTEQTYDSDGRLLKITWGGSGEVGTETLYAYDDFGRNLSITNTQNADRTEFHYAEDGRKTTVKTRDPKTILGAKGYGFDVSPWDAAVGGHGVPAGGKIRTIYNEKDQPTEAQVLDAGGQVVSRFVRTFDADGRISEEKPIWENPTLMFLDRFPPKQRDQMTPERVPMLNKGLSAMLGGKAQAGNDAHSYGK